MDKLLMSKVIIMHRKYFYFIVVSAIASAIFIAFSMWSTAHVPIPEQEIQLAQRPLSPYTSYISGVGIVEPSSENIHIGSPVNRVVNKINVSVGEKVHKGDILFQLEARDLEADLLARKVAFQNSIANLQKLEALPRFEDVVSNEAILMSAEIELSQAEDQYLSTQGLEKSGALSQEAINNRRFKFEQAGAKVQQLQAELEKIKAGAWLPDLEIARLQVQQAFADIQRVQAEIDRTVIRAPIDATVLQIKIHEGEFPPSEVSRTPPMILGDIDTLNLRVSINQFDASYYSPNSPAVAFLQGNAQLKFALKFVQLEPIFVNKQNLTNDISEKVDTRVLQVIYSFEEHNHHIFVGQQMDVFIETQYSPLN